MTCEVSYEELSEFAAAEMTEGRASEVRRHLAGCEACRRRLRTLGAVDSRLRMIRPQQPPAEAVLQTRRLLSRETGRAGAPDVMTLEEVAEFLRIDDLAEAVDDLPAFEIAGQVRVRRVKLLEWIEGRERAFARSTLESEVAGILAGLR